MLHIYRQITGLRRVQSIVIAQKRENPDKFPFDKIDIVAKPATHFLRRFWFRQVRNKPWQISSKELRALIGVLNREKAQLLHTFFGHIVVHLLPLIQAWPKPSIVSFHGADVSVDMEKPAYRNATKEMLDRVTRVFVRSASLRRAVVELGCDEDKIDIVCTGIPLDEFPSREREFPANGEWRFVQASRLIEKKGLATTLHAFTAFLAHYPRATLTIAGEGPMLHEVQELTRKLKIENGVSGILVPERDHEALSYALLEAVQDRHLLARLARNGAAAVAEKFDQRNQIHRLEEIYLGMIGRVG